MSRWVEEEKHIPWVRGQHIWGHQSSRGQCLKWRVILGEKSGRWVIMISWGFHGGLWKTVWPLGSILQNRVPKLVLKKSYFYLHTILKSNNQVGGEGSAFEQQVEALPEEMISWLTPGLQQVFQAGRYYDSCQTLQSFPCICEQKTDKIAVVHFFLFPINWADGIFIVSLVLINP